MSLTGKRTVTISYYSEGFTTMNTRGCTKITRMSVHNSIEINLNCALLTCIFINLQEDLFELTPDATTLTPDATTLTQDARALTPDATTLTQDARALTQDARALTQDATALTLDIIT